MPLQMPKSPQEFNPSNPSNLINFSSFDNPTNPQSNPKPTIAIVISSLRMGGAEKVASLLANHLSVKYRVIMILWENKEQFYPLENSITIFCPHKKFRGIWGNFRRLGFLIKIFKSQKVSLAISLIHQTNILSILAAKIAKIPIIATEHSTYESLESQKLWNFLRQRVYPLANCITTLTHGDLKHYDFLKNIRIMPNPIYLKCPNTKDLAKLTQEFNTYKPYVLSVGRMIESKHFDEVLRAFKIFSKSYPHYSLVLIGEGKCQNALEEMARTLGIKAVFLGRREELVCAYAQAEFFALASHKEGLSNVLIESLLCETPVVSYDCPYGPAEIITNGENGYLVELGNIEALAEAFCKAVKNREMLSHNASKIQEKFGTKQVFKQWEALITEFQDN